VCEGGDVLDKEKDAGQDINKVMNIHCEMFVLMSLYDWFVLHVY
jgi:hypothetical protein